MASITTGGTTTAGTVLSDSSISVLQPTVARTISLGASSVNLALTVTCRYVSLICTGGSHCHFVIGTGTQTATSSNHYLKTGERIVVAVPANANIAAIQGAGASTTLYISELEQ